MGWSAVRGVLDWSVLPLYLSCFAWTVIYDSIYAFQVVSVFSSRSLHYHLDIHVYNLGAFCSHTYIELCK